MDAFIEMINDETITYYMRWNQGISCKSKVPMKAIYCVTHCQPIDANNSCKDF